MSRFIFDLRRRLPLMLLLYGLCLLPVLAASAAPATGRDLTLIYSGNLNGELEPCGCTAEGDFGGIRRRATALDRLRAERPDAFVISAGGLLSGFAANGRITNEYILKGFAHLSYDAIGLQWSDLQYGEDFLKQPALPWVASNWHDDGFSHARRIRHGGRTLAFFTWLDPGSAPQQNMQGDHRQVNDDPAALKEAVARARKDGAFTVVSTTLSLKEAQQRLPLQDVDVLLIRAKDETYGEPQLIDHTLVLQPGSRGMRLGRADIELGTDGRIAAWHHAVIPLPKSVPDAPALAQWYADYSAEVKANYQRMAALRKAQDQGKTPFAGAEACKTCHREAYDTWSRSRHAQAFSALEDVNKSFDPGCLKCHTVGFDKPGGFIDLDVTASLTNVQCESCHGGAREHVASGGSTPVANHNWQSPQMCAQCHTHPHSPLFDFNAYWPRIKH
jgi:hypothetical protein